MCLAVKKDVNLKVAVDDIVCYKVVRRYQNLVRNSTQISYETPYRDIPISLNTMYNESDKNMEIKPGANFLDPNIWSFYKSVYGNAFHSFANLKDAKWEASDWGLPSKDANGYREFEYVVVKCIIPSGAKYYEGVIGIYNNSIAAFPDGYASDMIKYTNEVYAVTPWREDVK